MTLSMTTFSIMALSVGAIMQSVVMLNVVMVNVILLSVVAPWHMEMKESKRELFLAFSTVLNTKDIFNKRYGIEDSQKFLRLSCD
jgi:hypothetical protein